METQLPSTPPPPCCSPKSKLFCLSAGLVIVIIVAIASFLLGRALPRDPEGILRGIPSPTPTPDQTVYTEDSRSANWKTYTNPNVPFTFKYPPQLAFFVQDIAETTGLKNILIQIQNFDNKSTPDDFDTNPEYFNFGISGAATRANFNSRLEDSDMGLDKEGRKKIIIDGVEAYEGTGMVHWQRGIKMVMFPYKDWIFSVRALPSNSKYLPWFNQILSTFQFLD